MWGLATVTCPGVRPCRHPAASVGSRLANTLVSLLPSRSLCGQKKLEEKLWVPTFCCANCTALLPDPSSLCPRLLGLPPQAHSSSGSGQPCHVPQGQWQGQHPADPRGAVGKGLAHRDREWAPPEEMSACILLRRWRWLPSWGEGCQGLLTAVSACWGDERCLSEKMADSGLRCLRKWQVLPSWRNGWQWPSEETDGRTFWRNGCQCLPRRWSCLAEEMSIDAPQQEAVGDTAERCQVTAGCYVAASGEIQTAIFLGINKIRLIHRGSLCSQYWQK